MAYSNPFMQVMAQGGQLANQTANVANSMMANVQRSMQTTSDLAFKMDKLLKDEQARKFTQQLQTQQFLYRQTQDAIRNKLAEQSIAETRARTNIASRAQGLAEKQYADCGIAEGPTNAAGTVLCSGITGITGIHENPAFEGKIGCSGNSAITE